MVFLLTQALAAPAVLAVTPFGIGLYAEQRPVRGAVHSVLQAAGFTALGVGSAMAARSAEDETLAEYQRWQLVGISGASAGFGSWMVSAIDAARVHELAAAEQAARLRAWDAQIVLHRGYSND